MGTNDRNRSRDSSCKSHLCEGGLKIWKANLEKAAGYRCKDLPNGEKEIQAIDFDPAINCIRIISDTKRCDCASRVAFLAPCRHEICADAMSFRMDRWPERFYLRQCLEISMPETQSVTLLEGSASFAMTSNSSSALGSTECGLDCEMINDTVDWGDNHDDGSEEGYVMGETDNDGVAGKENRTPATPAWSRKAKYARIQSLAQQATESIIQSKDWEMFCGILIEITEAAKGDSSAFMHAFTTSNRLSAPRKDELEDKSRRYAASFTSYRPSAGIFSGSSQDDVSAPPLQPRTGGTNHPTKKRFRSGHDKFKLTSSQRNAPRCGFCQSTQHNIRNCEKLKSLNGTLIPNKESLNVFAESAGSPNKFNVELAPQELQRLFSAIDWDVSLPWPREAEHVVVIRFFLGPQQVVASSRYACRSAQCDSRSNIAEVDFYSRAGERILLENPQSRFYRVDKLCTLLSDHVKGTKKLINTVSSPKKMRGDDFIYG
jgi:hypothetical protein